MSFAVYENALRDPGIDRADLAKVAMFPLPNVVLLPGGLIPLHVFEPRYRDMTQDVLSGTGVLALARLRQGFEVDYNGRPAVYPTVGVGRIIDYRQLQDGRFDILVRGLIRASVAEELPAVHKYREVRAVPLSDVTKELPAILFATQRKLVALCDRLAELLEHGGSELRILVRSSGSPGECADTISAVLVADPDERQVLLETRDPLRRLERVIRHVNRIVHELDTNGDPGLMN